ncbi:MAG: hypothetical protein H7Y89_06420 [Steroidobacteraceae bacterium]|nr:hypothetical protein [Steroidobacteraceae bacterium]
MRTRLCLMTLAALAAPQSAVHSLTPPSSSDGPIKLLACVVTPTGILEAEVDSQSDDAVSCNIRCNYSLGEQTFSHSFTVRIPARFNGRVGRFDTSNGKTGTYSGDVGACEKVSR